MVGSVASPAKRKSAAIELAFLVGNSLPIQLGAHLTLERCKRPFDQCQVRQVRLSDRLHHAAPAKRQKICGQQAQCCHQTRPGWKYHPVKQGLGVRAVRRHPSYRRRDCSARIAPVFGTFAQSSAPSASSARASTEVPPTSTAILVADALTFHSTGALSIRRCSRPLQSCPPRNTHRFDGPASYRPARGLWSEHRRRRV